MHMYMYMYMYLCVAHRHFGPRHSGKLCFAAALSSTRLRMDFSTGQVGNSMQRQVRRQRPLFHDATPLTDNQIYTALDPARQALLRVVGWESESPWALLIYVSVLLTDGSTAYMQLSFRRGFRPCPVEHPFGVFEPPR